MAAHAAVAGVVYLYVRIITASNGGEDSRTAYANWETCKQAAASARIVTASGGDAENVAVVWCGGPRANQLNDGSWQPAK